MGAGRAWPVPVLKETPGIKPELAIARSGYGLDDHSSQRAHNLGSASAASSAPVEPCLQVLALLDLLPGGMMEDGGPLTCTLASGPAVERSIGEPVGAYALDSNYDLCWDVSRLRQLNLDGVKLGVDMYDGWDKASAAEYRLRRSMFDRSSRHAEDLFRAAERWAGTPEVHSAGFALTRSTLLKLLQAPHDRRGYKLDVASVGGKLYINQALADEVLEQRLGSCWGPARGGSVDSRTSRRGERSRPQ